MVTVSEYNTTRSARTARKHYRCDEGARRHRIAPGDRYLRHVVFPGHDIVNPDKPITLRECVACAIEHGREHETGACQTYCCGVEPCPKPFNHTGDHGCPICTPAPPTKEIVLPERLRYAGANPCADMAFIFEGPAKIGQQQPRQIALIRRSNNGTWALPGGRLNPGELADIATFREMKEETGVDLTEVPHELQVLRKDVRVDDPRNEEDRWITTTLTMARVTEQVTLVAGDDAIDARWFPMVTVGSLIEHLSSSGLGELYQPHPKLLHAVVEELALHDLIIARFDDYIGRDLLHTGVPEDEVLRQRRTYIRDVRRNPRALHAITSSAD